MHIDPSSAALYSLIAICFVLIGAILTPGTVSVDQRAAILAAIAGVLFAIAWRGRRRDPPDIGDGL
jgi:membrane associated rhomboid family serine protease